MDVALVNDGPVTILLDSNEGPPPPAPKNFEIAQEKTRKKKEAMEVAKAKRAEIEG